MEHIKFFVTLKKKKNIYITLTIPVNFMLETTMINEPINSENMNKKVSSN